MTHEQSPRHSRTGDETAGRMATGWVRSVTVEVALQPRWRSWIFFLVVASGVGFLGGEALRAAFVSILGESVEVEPLRRAVKLAPADPELHHRLGMVLCDSLAEGDRTEGVRQLRRATELDPHAARYWADLAWACEIGGDTAGATRGVEQAVRLSPMTPRWHWVAANTFLRAGQSDAAMAEFRRLLELDPAYGPATFHICVGTFGDPQLILQRVLSAGKNPELKLAYLNFLSTSEFANFAPQVWVQIVQDATPFPFPLAAPYIDHLLQSGQAEEAKGAWQDLEKLGVVPKPEASEGDNLVFNGDFEQTPLDAGLDWRHRADPYIALDFSDADAHTGKRCLRIDFPVRRNEEYMPLEQLVPVVPNRAYWLTAWVRSQDITSESGPRLQVTDQVHPGGLSAASETTIATTPWHPISLKFCTGPDTNLVQLSVARMRARTFPTEITGSFWLDTLVLKASGPANANACRAVEH